MLLTSAALAYETPAPGGGGVGGGTATGGVSGSTATGGVSAGSATLPNTSADRPAKGVDPILIAGTAAGGGLILLSGLGLAYRRRLS